jgi:hypothetical protein
MASRYASSLSFASTHTQKNRPAYRRYTTLKFRSCALLSLAPPPCASTHLDEVGLVLLVPRRDEAVDLAAQAHLLVVRVRRVPLGQPRLALPVLLHAPS